MTRNNRNTFKKNVLFKNIIVIHGLGTSALVGNSSVYQNLCNNPIFTKLIIKIFCHVFLNQFFIF